MEEEAYPTLSMDDVRLYYASGAPLPKQFYLRDGPAAAKRLIVLSDGAHITTENAALTPEVRAALVALADLVEYERVGSVAFGDGGIELSTAIDGGWADAHQQQLRELVPPRLAHIRLWLSEPAQLPSAQPAGMSDLLWRECRRGWLQHRLEQLRRAQACVVTLTPFVEQLLVPS